MKEIVRAIGGLLTIVTILGLVSASAVLPGVKLPVEHLQLLVAMVGGLLGLDILLQRIPVKLDVSALNDDDDGGE